jgi:hypothetical protein
MAMDQPTILSAVVLQHMSATILLSRLGGSWLIGAACALVIYHCTWCPVSALLYQKTPTHLVSAQP